MSDTLTHKALADLLGVSVTTIKSYRRKFSGCIPVENQGKPIRFKPQAATVGTRIRDFFNQGMSVPEVRLRLAQEFDWISADAPKGGEDEACDSGDALREKADVSPDLAHNVNTLAKSMVAMSQQQKSVLQRMQVIEDMLEQLGLKDLSESARQLRAETGQAESLLEERLGNLDSVTQALADTMGSLSDRLEKFLGGRQAAAEEWQAQGGLSGALSELAKEEGKQADESPNKVVSFNAVKNRPTPGPAREEASQSQVHAAQPSQEPSRAFLTSPLIVRTAQGNHISPAGRNRGRFSINDLKAMLIYGFSPPNHYTLHWEPHGQGWWLKLKQEENPDNEPLYLLLMELPAQGGGSVVEILQVKRGEDNLHPVEICAIIDSFSGI